MKKTMSIVASAFLVLALTACGTSTTVNDKTANNETTKMPVVENESTSEPEPKPTEEPLSTTDGIDIDLTILSSTMVYSEVYNMMSAPDGFVGKKVKMEGQFAHYRDENSGKDYYACIISDATACCSQGIEFELTDEYTYPDDYPEDGSDICVVGTFDTYQEAGSGYCTLRKAKIVKT